MTWSSLLYGAAGAGVPLLVLPYAVCRVAAAANAWIHLHYELARERERRATLVAAAGAVAGGGAVVHFDGGLPQWGVWIPLSPVDEPVGAVPELRGAA
ncbi:hypothetical protein [Kitasatospora sp. NPDC004531]